MNKLQFFSQVNKHIFLTQYKFNSVQGQVVQ